MLAASCKRFPYPKPEAVSEIVSEKRPISELELHGATFGALRRSRARIPEAHLANEWTPRNQEMVL